MVLESQAIKRYSDILKKIAKINFPSLTDNDITAAINYSVNKRYKEEKAVIDNNYNNKKVAMSLLDIADYIIDREPIITNYGVLFKRKGTVPNPLEKMIKSFMDKRDIDKSLMFKFPKGSEQFEKYNLAQLLDKIDVNGLYGVLGLYCCMYYNIHVCASVTAQGRALVSSAGMCFEQFLSNNVKFGSLDQIITFIYNVMSEESERKFNDNDILDRNITREECFIKIIYTCGFEWIPDEEDLNIVWDLINKLDQTTLNRLYYKNNLYEFISNSKIMNIIKQLLHALNAPFMNPNKAPKEIEVELDALTEIIMEYVYYHHLIIDSVDRMDNMVKNICAISDTDSTIISLDAWYRCILDNIKGEDFNILHMGVNLVDFFDYDEFGEIPQESLVEFDEPILDYDFYDDEVIERERSYNLETIIPQDELRYSIINILAYMLSKIIKDYMERFCEISNSYDRNKGDKCLIIMKNEFLFKRALLTPAKKNYATIQEVQEGNMVAKKKRLDLKGLAIDKASMNSKTRKMLKQILLEDILEIETIDQINIIKKMAIAEDNIYQSLHSGKKEYYKPVTVKAITNYADPMSIQGIKASVAWNIIREPYMEAIDLNERNSIDIVKVAINPTTAEKIKDIYPDVYLRIISIIGTKDKEPDKKYASYKGSISSLAIPKDIEVPEWVIPFIDYTAIINDNLCNFPLESVGIRCLGKDSLNYTNIVKL